MLNLISKKTKMCTNIITYIDDINFVYEIFLLNNDYEENIPNQFAMK